MPSNDSYESNRSDLYNWPESTAGGLWRGREGRDRPLQNDCTKNHNGSPLNRHEHYTFVAEGAEKRGELKPGGTVVEYTGESTGSSLAMVCAKNGYPAHWRCFNLVWIKKPSLFCQLKNGTVYQIGTLS